MSDEQREHPPSVLSYERPIAIIVTGDNVISHHAGHLDRFRVALRWSIRSAVAVMRCDQVPYEGITIDQSSR